MLLSGVRWGFLWQRHQTLATLFAASGYPTVFVETTGLANPRPTARSLGAVLSRLAAPRSVPPARPDGPALYAPLVLPPTARPFRRLNARLFLPRVVRDIRRTLDRVSGTSGGERPIVVAYAPTRTTLDLARALSPRLLVYDCCDEYAAFPGVPKDVFATERELLLRAGVVFCTSPPLLDRVRALRPDALPSGPGVEYARFARVGDVANERSSGAPPEVCFFGDVGPERVSVGVLAGLARAGFRVRLVGPLRGVARGLSKLPNVDYRGVVGHAELPGALRGVGAFVLPYRESSLTRAIHPAKLYECLATGLPTLATTLPALGGPIAAGLVYGARGTREYVRALRRLAAPESADLPAARRALAASNSWEKVFARLEAVLQEKLGEMPCTEPDR